MDRVVCKYKNIQKKYSQDELIYVIKEIQQVSMCRNLTKHEKN